MCQGAAAGVIDFARADPRDRLWWYQLRILADQLADRNASEVGRLNHRMATALLSRTDLDADSNTRLRDHAESLATAIKERLFPWMEFDHESLLAKAATAMREQWARTWGDPDDPETDRKIDATVAHMAAQLASSTRAAKGAF